MRSRLHPLIVVALAIPVCLFASMVAPFSWEPEERYAKLTDWLFK